jgi:predicted lipoprotein with Yx(FWY)xxD motif
VVLAGCGSAGQSGGGAATAPASDGAAAVSASDNPRLGRILVDSTGRTVYVAEQEAAGAIHCTGACLQFWLPVVSSDGTAPAIPGVQPLSVVKRTDNGQNQLAFDGKPLYTFKLDHAAGDSAGNNVGDDFNGVHFTWHAATLGGAAPAAPSTSSSQGGGYGNY